MSQFLAVFTGTPGAGAGLDQETIGKGMAAWGAWMQTHAASLVFTGGPLGKTKEVSKSGTKDISNKMSGFVIVEAADHAAAARMFEGHPQFTIFPGEGVEVMQVMPIPGQG